MRSKFCNVFMFKFFIQANFSSYIKEKRYCLCTITKNNYLEKSKLRIQEERILVWKHWLNTTWIRTTATLSCYFLGRMTMLADHPPFIGQMNGSPVIWKDECHLLQWLSSFLKTLRKFSRKPSTWNSPIKYDYYSVRKTPAYLQKRWERNLWVRYYWWLVLFLTFLYFPNL